MTEHATDEGKLYLAVVIDAFSRMVVGWSMGDRPVADLAVDAVNMAVWNRRPGPGLVHHSDHGAQYTAVAFGRTLKEAGILCSMGTVGDALDNAVAESFFATLETELLDRRSWPSRQALASAIFEYVEGFLQPEASALNPRISKSCGVRKEVGHHREKSQGSQTVRRVALEYPRNRINSIVDRVAAFRKDKLVACWPRCYEKGHKFVDFDHYLEVLVQEPGAVPFVSGFKDLCPLYQELYTAVSKMESGNKLFVRILLLAREYPREMVDRAIEKALRSGNVSYEYIVATLRRTSLAMDRPHAAGQALPGKLLEFRVRPANVSQFNMLIGEGREDV